MILQASKAKEQLALVMETNMTSQRSMCFTYLVFLQLPLQTHTRLNPCFKTVPNPIEVIALDKVVKK